MATDVGTQQKKKSSVLVHLLQRVIAFCVAVWSPQTPAVSIVAGQCRNISVAVLDMCINSVCLAITLAAVAASQA